MASAIAAAAAAPDLTSALQTPLSSANDKAAAGSVSVRLGLGGTAVTQDSLGVDSNSSKVTNSPIFPAADTRVGLGYSLQASKAGRPTAGVADAAQTAAAVVAEVMGAVGPSPVAAALAKVSNAVAAPARNTGAGLSQPRSMVSIAASASPEPIGATPKPEEVSKALLTTAAAVKSPSQFVLPSYVSSHPLILHQTTQDTAASGGDGELHLGCRAAIHTCTLFALLEMECMLDQLCTIDSRPSLKTIIHSS